MAIDLASAIVSELILIILALLVVYVVFKLGKFIVGLLVNVVLGFISIFLLNALFNIGIPFDLVVIIITAILGLPGVAIIVLLRIFGITL